MERGQRPPAGPAEGPSERSHRPDYAQPLRLVRRRQRQPLHMEMQSTPTVVVLRFFV